MLTITYSSPFSRYSIIQENEVAHIVSCMPTIHTLKTFDTDYFAFDIVEFVKYFVQLLCKEQHFYNTFLIQSLKDFASSDFMRETREYIKENK